MIAPKDSEQILKLKRCAALSRPRWVCSALGLATPASPRQRRGLWARCCRCHRDAKLSARVYGDRKQARLMFVCFSCDFKGDICQVVREVFHTRSLTEMLIRTENLAAYIEQEVQKGKL